MSRPPRLALLILYTWLAAIAAPVATAQDAFAPSASPASGPAISVGPDGKPVARPRGPRNAKAKPDAEPQPEKDGEKKKEGDEEKESTIVKRPEKPAQPADPRELEVIPDNDGTVQFGFRGQSWPDVLDWLAKVANLSLDWQELPAGHLNLTTQRRYSIDEARDLINRHLLARGFTMLVNDEIVSVVNLAKLDPGMVPRVEASELANRQPHEFVKVSFQLEWLLAEQAAKELEPMKSPHGKLSALTNTNRLEAVDVVVNLREIHQLLEQEQSGRGQDRLMREFLLQHVRATEVLEQLQKLLGLESQQPSGPMTPQQMQQMQRAQQRMMQQMQQQGKNATPPKKEPEVNLVVNTRKNSVLAHAPPDKMAIIEQAIQTIDVAHDRGSSLLANPNRMQVYRLYALDPQTIVRTLEDLGELDPTTRLEVDEKNQAIIAYASLADQMTIRQLVDRLDGSGRRFEVIPLKRLAADYVAGTIDFMMGPEEEPQSQRSPFYFYPSRNQPQQQEKDKFRVDADIENNFVLLWASEIEIEEVMNLLVKLGEIPPEGGRTSTMRVLDAVPAEDLERMLDRLRRAWPALAPNPLTLPQLEKEPDEDVQPPAADAPKKRTEASLPRPKTFAAQFAVFEEEAAAGEDAAEGAQREAASSGPPAGTSDSQPAPINRRQSAAPAGPAAGAPVNIGVGPDGRLVLTSRDPAALDMLEELIGQLAPRRPSYKVFRLQHADAYYVKLNLVDFFEEEEEEQFSRNSRVYVYDYGSTPKKEKKRYRLSERRKLKFIYDYDTNSILVQGADAQQLQEIADLIALYDKPEPADSQSVRRDFIYQVRYSQANLIAEAVKEVYRDLLSSNDKSLNQNPEQKNRPSSGTTYIFGDGDSDGNPGERTHVNFKGKLSIGVDTLSNTLLVSAEGDNLLNNVTTMVRSLDEAARPLSNVSVIKLDGALNTARVRDVVASVLAAEGKTAAKPSPGPQNGQQPAGGRGPRGNGGGNFQSTPAAAQ